MKQLLSWKNNDNLKTKICLSLKHFHIMRTLIQHNLICHHLTQERYPERFFYQQNAIVHSHLFINIFIIFDFLCNLKQQLF